MTFMVLGDFPLHSGGIGKFKIECDDLTDDDIACFAWVISQKYSFNKVYGIPRGGDRIAKALEKYIDPNALLPIVVDDVLTTGGSMLEFLQKKNLSPITAICVVLFSRIKPPLMVDAIFTFWHEG